MNSKQDKLIKLRQGYKADSVSKLWLLSILQIVSISLTGLFIFMQINSRPDPLFFDVTKHEQVIDPVPLDEPSITDAALLNIVNEAINLAYTFNYKNISDQANKLKDYFDDRGMKTYVKVLQEDDTMKRVVPDKLIVSMKANKAPQIVREGSFKGRYTWRIQIPVSVRYENKEKLIRSEVEVDVVVWRVPEIISPNGIKITTIRAKVKNRYDMQQL